MKMANEYGARSTNDTIETTSSTNERLSRRSFSSKDISVARFDQRVILL